MLVSMETATEWPPGSRQRIVIPEIDRAAFFTLERAELALNPAQVELLGRLMLALEGGDVG